MTFLDPPAIVWRLWKYKVESRNFAREFAKEIKVFSVLEYINAHDNPTRAEIGRAFSLRSNGEMVEREISFLVINGLIQRCMTCAELRYQITEKGKESLPK